MITWKSNLIINLAYYLRPNISETHYKNPFTVLTAKLLYLMWDMGTS